MFIIKINLLLLLNNIITHLSNKKKKLKKMLEKIQQHSVKIKIKELKV
jgi:hypothetical protein